MLHDCSKKERLRGDTSVWDVDDNNTVGLITKGTFKSKYKYDHVFRGDASNQEVYQTVAGDVVRTAMNGINGTVFAYGVTSSGKTHTMMGDAAEPGIVPQAVHQLFELIENMPSKEFLLRLSMMEIYNEVGARSSVAPTCFFSGGRCPWVTPAVLLMRSVSLGHWCLCFHARAASSRFSWVAASFCTVCGV